MDTNTLSPKVAATLAAPVCQTKNCNLSPGSKRLVVSKVWDSMRRGARKGGGVQGFATSHNLPHLVSATGACENTDLIHHANAT
jgi:hypothetical protein